MTAVTSVHIHYFLKMKDNGEKGLKRNIILYNLTDELHLASSKLLDAHVRTCLFFRIKDLIKQNNVFVRFQPHKDERLIHVLSTECPMA